MKHFNAASMNGCIQDGGFMIEMAVIHNRKGYLNLMDNAGPHESGMRHLVTVLETACSALCYIMLR